MTKQQKAIQFIQAYEQNSPQALICLLNLNQATGLEISECFNRIKELAETGKCKEEI